MSKKNRLLKALRNVPMSYKDKINFINVLLNL